MDWRDVLIAHPFLPSFRSGVSFLDPSVNPWILDAVEEVLEDYGRFEFHWKVVIPADENMAHFMGHHARAIFRPSFLQVIGTYRDGSGRGCEKPRVSWRLQYPDVCVAAESSAERLEMTDPRIGSGGHFQMLHDEAPIPQASIKPFAATRSSPGGTLQR